MEKLSLIVRLTDGLPLAESRYDESVLPNSDAYKQKALTLVRNLSGGENVDSTMSVETGEHYTFHYLIEGEVCYLTMCQSSYTKEHAFRYLSDLKTAFQSVDGQIVETASYPFGFGTFNKTCNHLYKKGPPTLLSLCVKSLRDDGITSTAQLQELEHISGMDLTPITDSIWRDFYEKDFGCKDKELVQRNLTRSKAKCTWSQLYHEKKSCDEFIFNNMSRKVADSYAAAASRKRSTKLLTGEQVNDDRVEVQTEKESTTLRLVEFCIVGPLIPPPGFADVVRNFNSVVVSMDETIPEGRIYKVACHESFDAPSPSTKAVTKIFHALNRRATNGIFQSTLITTHQCKQLDIWSIMFGAQMSPKPNGDTTVIKISGGTKYFLITAFTRLLSLLRECVFHH